MKQLKNEQIEHLRWIYDRMINVHKENENFDYMHKFLSIIEKLNTDSVLMNPGSEPLKTSNEWLKDYPNIIIMDPDGWDRKNYHYSFFQEIISKKEFEKRLYISTCLNKII